jgi:Protein of unknown function (DUF938)
MDDRCYAPATQRNREPILAVLRRVLPASGVVLEVASGTGEHAVWIAANLPGLVIQPSDPDPDNRASIAAWTGFTGVANVRPPLPVDVTAPAWEAGEGIPAEPAAILCINMIHISSWSAALGLMRGAGALLPPGGVLYLYGAYKRGGAHTAPSNASFDQSLRARDPDWGVRDLEAVTGAAERAGLAPESVIEMPANNLSVVLRRGAPG